MHMQMHSNELGVEDPSRPWKNELIDEKGWAVGRVSFETSLDWKQTKLVLPLYETKFLFWLLCFYTKTESFGVSIEPKQTEDQPKQFDKEHILIFFRKYRVFLVCFSCFNVGLNTVKH